MISFDRLLPYVLHGTLVFLLGLFAGAGGYRAARCQDLERWDWVFAVFVMASVQALIVLFAIAEGREFSTSRRCAKSQRDVQWKRRLP